MGTVGDALDNAVAESFFASLQCELLDRHRWGSRAELARAMFHDVEAFYNPLRRHRPGNGVNSNHPVQGDVWFMAVGLC